MKTPRKHAAIAGTSLSIGDYHIWWLMIARCTKPTSKDFENYGGRGITVCDRWLHDPVTFWADMGPKPAHTTLDRINNDGPYAPDNCRWATRFEQGSNKRNNHLLPYQGQMWPLNALARHLGIPRTRLAQRLRRGWPIELATSHSPWKRRPEHSRKSKQIDNLTVS